MINQGYQSVLPVTSNDNGYNLQVETIKQLTRGMATAMLVSVTKVDDVKKTISALPLVTQVDGNGQPISQGLINGVPYLPLQYGNNAILMTPAVGDIGLCVFCHSDISTVKKTKKESLPGSYRKHSMSDGIYIGGLLNPAPVNFIEFKDNSINMKATTLNINANVVITGTVTDNGKNIGSTHTHSGVQTGSGNTGAPN